MKPLTWQDVIGWRLHRGHLAQPAPADSITRVVGDTAGVQAQVMSAAELSVGVRVSGVTVADLHEEFWQRRMIVKTYGPRETLHLFPAAELPLWMAAMRARQEAQEVPWYS